MCLLRNSNNVALKQSISRGVVRVRQTGNSSEDRSVQCMVRGKSPGAFHWH